MTRSRGPRLPRETGRINAGLTSRVLLRLTLMGDTPKLVVVAHPRSGSNSLLEILDCHPELTFLNEPFNEGFSSWLPGNPDYRARINDAASLDQVIGSILADYSGFKVHTYQLETELLAHLLRRRDLYVVFLRRRNLLEAVVSNLIAEQTGLWAAWDRDRALEDYYTDLSPLSMEDIRELLEWTRENLAEVAAILGARSDGRVLELYYEDLFLGERSTRWQLVESVWAHLGLPPCENPQVGRFLANASLRMRKPATYGRLPNLAEIEATFGNDETGHIGYLAPLDSSAAEA
jgi:LPS sulfotransferase NodH